MSARRGIAKLACGVAFIGLLGGCSAAASVLPSTESTPRRPVGVEVSNGTTLAITIAVNNVVVRDIGPGDWTHEPITADLGLMPWKVEARTSAGRVLLTFTVNPGDVVYQASMAQGDAARVDLSCGRLDVWVGPPLSGPSPGPGVPGDCRP